MTMMTISGVATQEGWSLKAWWSMSRNAWLIQVEHLIPERGGWIRGWLVRETGEPAVYHSLEAAWEAIDTFLAAPHWARCREFDGV